MFGRIFGLIVLGSVLTSGSAFAYVGGIGGVPDVRMPTPNNLSMQAPYFSTTVPNLGTRVPNLGSNVPNLGTTVPNLGTTVPNLSIAAPNFSTNVPNLSINGPGNLTAAVPNLSIMAPNLGIGVPGDLTSAVPDLRMRAPDFSQPHPPGGGNSYYTVRNGDNYGGGYYTYRNPTPQDYYNQQLRNSGLKNSADGQMGYGDYCIHYQPGLGNCRFNYVAPVQKQQTQNFKPVNNSQVYKRSNNFVESNNGYYSSNANSSFTGGFNNFINGR